MHSSAKPAPLRHAGPIEQLIARQLYGANLAHLPVMPSKQLRVGQGFKVALANASAQAATMVIAPGDCEGGPDNRHRGADQWLFVISGTGLAIVGRRRHRLRAGTLVLIERRTTHEIRNTGRTELRTLNVYVPPAYTKSGDELPRGRS